MTCGSAIASITAACEAVHAGAVAVAVEGALGADVNPIDGPLLGVVMHGEVALVPPEPHGPGNKGN